LELTISAIKKEFFGPEERGDQMLMTLLERDQLARYHLGNDPDALPLHQDEAFIRGWGGRCSSGDGIKPCSRFNSQLGGL
jgi:hypothetical protein